MKKNTIIKLFIVFLANLLPFLCAMPQDEIISPAVGLKTRANSLTYSSESDTPNDDYLLDDDLKGLSIKTPCKTPPIQKRKSPYSIATFNASPLPQLKSNLETQELLYTLPVATLRELINETKKQLLLTLYLGLLIEHNYKEKSLEAGIFDFNNVTEAAAQRLNIFQDAISKEKKVNNILASLFDIFLFYSKVSILLQECSNPLENNMHNGITKQEIAFIESLFNNFDKDNPYYFPDTSQIKDNVDTLLFINKKIIAQNLYLIINFSPSTFPPIQEKMNILTNDTFFDDEETYDAYKEANRHNPWFALEIKLRMLKDTIYYRKLNNISFSNLYTLLEDLAVLCNEKINTTNNNSEKINTYSESDETNEELFFNKNAKIIDIHNPINEINFFNEVYNNCSIEL